MNCLSSIGKACVRFSVIVVFLVTEYYNYEPSQVLKCSDSFVKFLANSSLTALQNLMSRAYSQPNAAVIVWDGF